MTPELRSALTRKPVEGHSRGDWAGGCFINPDSGCRCRYIFAQGYFGSVATISKQTLGEHANDSPPEEEAIANARLIVTAPALQAELLAVREALVELAWRISACVVSEDDYLRLSDKDKKRWVNSDELADEILAIHHGETPEEE